MGQSKIKRKTINSSKLEPGASIVQKRKKEWNYHTEKKKAGIETNPRNVGVKCNSWQ